MTSQREILLKVAKNHGLTIGQAEEIWNLFGGTIASAIGDTDKKTDGLYDPEKFKTIHIHFLGKFIPSPRVIKHSNYHLKLKQNGSKHNITNIEE